MIKTDQDDYTPPDIKLLPGDIFCSRNPMWLGIAINAVQRFWDVDNQCDYGHAGIITGVFGNTLEALWTVKAQNVWRAYDSPDRGGLLIGRNQNMTYDKFLAGMEAVKVYKGNPYPLWRLFLHLIPPLGKYLSTGKFLVCSELTAKFLVGAGELNFYKGVTPDYLQDMIEHWDEWDIVYEKERRDVNNCNA